MIAILVATMAAFAASSIWYTAFGGLWARLSPAAAPSRPSAWRAGAEFARTLVLVAAFAALSAAVGVAGVPGSVGLALLRWAGFPAVILSGSVLHERVPVRLAALHAGDWLLKIVLVAAIMGA
ncbi:DUF1761 domain-containing protein [Amycolatopsis solani]|uniref:DUF1761 domain-containing protein n=1 Tax=Amycolatopsis solani TaxID=3028615 RepID=UPI0025B186F7|nr:DUF1761 domain-containing protein [Amycolatopsis sp. MEP2-6]